MNDFTMWYSTPAAHWSQGLPLGNGRIGAVVMASSHREVWSMSEVTFWSGRIEQEQPSAGSKAALEEMRSHFFSGDYDEGDRLAKQHLQPKKGNFGTHLGLCEVVIDMEKKNSSSDEAGSFQRELDLTQALAGAFWKDDNSMIRREVFASNVDDLVASRVWSEAPGGVTFTLGLQAGTESFKVVALDDNTLEFQGQATENVHSDGTCGVWSKGLVKLVISGGPSQVLMVD